MIWPFRSKTPALASKIGIKPPAPAPDRHGLAIVVIARNEASRIHDWLSFHALAGARHIFLYDNMSTDLTATIARNFTAIPVTVIPWQLHTSTVKNPTILPRQMLAYCHAISTFGADFRWMAMIDVDEFLVPQNQLTIAETLVELDHLTNISLPWTMFGHGGHDAPPVDPVPFAYTQRARHAQGRLLNFKCILDPTDVTKVSVHKFETHKTGAQSANIKGQMAHNKKRHDPRFITTDILQLNHYYLMSRQDTAAKIAGGALSGVTQDNRARAIGLKQDLIESDTVPDTTAIDFLARHGVTNGPALRAMYQD